MSRRLHTRAGMQRRPQRALADAVEAPARQSSWQRETGRARRRAYASRQILLCCARCAASTASAHIIK
eukprot:6595121-Prymnesium_polylepis.1